MKAFGYLLMACGVLLTSFEVPRHENAEPIAVLELFTSQGCSSCPAADKLVDELVDNAETAGQHVYALSFHVSYWNHLGWKDPYSKEEYTNRQKDYQQVLELPQLYTPQLIVNGQQEVVGSDRGAVTAAIRKALSSKVSYTITAAAQTTDEGVDISYTIDRKPKQALISVALVEKQRTDFVARGENKGRTLHHRNQTRLLQANDRFVLATPIGFDKKNAAVIIFIQDRVTYKVEGAVKTEIQ
jgi:hypothetical protein